MLLFIILVSTIASAFSRDQFYFLEFTCLVPSGDNSACACNSGTFRSSGQGFPLNLCIDVDPCGGDEDNCPSDRNKKSSYIYLLDEAQNNIITKEYEYLGCKEENYQSMSEDPLNVCRNDDFNEKPAPCDSTVYNACNFRYNQTSNGNDNCNGAKPADMGCIDSNILSLSPQPPQ